MSPDCRPYAYWSAFVASLGGFLQSYVTCAIAGALLFLSREFGLTPGQEGLAAGIILIGALLGSCCSGYLADRFGRRATLFIAAALFAICSLPILYISSFSILLFLRFASGIAAGLTSLTVPLYLAEIAPASKRGAFVASFQLSVTIGTLVAYLVNLALIEAEHWRGMLFFTVFPAVFQAIALFFTPESPKWLFKIGKIEKSAAVLQSLHSENGLPIHVGLTEVDANWKTLFAPLFRIGIGMGIALVIFQQWSGINAIVYFAPKIFQSAGFSTAKGAMIATLIMGIVNFFSTLLSLFIIDRIGRRKLLLISVAGVSLSLAIFTALFLFPSGSEPVLSVFSLMAYILLYSLGLGPITWVVISEIYPLAIRARAIAIMTFMSWLNNFLVVLTFPYLLSFLGPFGTFLSYTLLSIGAFCLYWRLIPETKGKSLEEIEHMLYH